MSTPTEKAAIYPLFTNKREIRLFKPAIQRAFLASFFRTCRSVCGRREKRALIEDRTPEKKIAIAAFFWQISYQTGDWASQYQPRLKRPWYSISDIESGRILANGAHFERIFHANPNGRFYGLFRQGHGSKKGNPGSIWTYFGSYLITPDPGIPRRETGRNDRFRAG